MRTRPCGAARCRLGREPHPEDSGAGIASRSRAPPGSRLVEALSRGIPSGETPQLWRPTDGFVFPSPASHFPFKVMVSMTPTRQHDNHRLSCCTPTSSGPRCQYRPRGAWTIGIHRHTPPLRARDVGVTDTLRAGSVRPSSITIYDVPRVAPYIAVIVQMNELTAVFAVIIARESRR